MRRYAVFVVLTLLCLSACKPRTPSLVGTWQGALGSRQTALILEQGHGGALSGVFYTLGTDAGGNPTSPVMHEGSAVKFELDHAAGAFEGALAADGKSIAGNWVAFGQSQPLTLERSASTAARVVDPSPHKTQFISVTPDVRLEVLDWGGDGPPLVFLAGGGNTAHVYDTFAVRFTGGHHVYGITRRGFGLSSVPPPTDDNYDSDRLGDDVVAVIAALKLDRPVVAGHSIAGAELSSLGTRHPDKIAGLIYLDAVSDPAYYAPSGFTFHVDSATVGRDLAQLAAASPGESRALIAEIQATLPRLQQGLQTLSGLLEGAPDGIPLPRQAKWVQVTQALLANPRKYTDIKSPVLAVMAVPHACAPECDNPKVKQTEAVLGAVVDAFEAGVPSARVVRIPYANHFIFRSHEAEVIREMDTFMSGLNTPAHTPR
jgi:non-heme chloroperoxidase